MPDRSLRSPFVPNHSFRVGVTLVLAAAVACTGPAEGPAPSPSDPQRIVSLAPALTEILFALDLGERVVGVTRFCDHPPEAATRVRVGGYVNPSVEAILSLEPDLVLVSPAAGNRESALAVERAGVPLAVVDADDLAGTYRAIETVARLCGVEERGTELARSLKARVEAVSSRVSALDPVPTLFCLQIEPIIGAGTGTLPAELLALAGGRNVLAAEGYPRLGVEAVIEAAPEVLLHSRMDASEAAGDETARAFWARWPSIPAVREGRVYVFDASPALRPGPRVADAVEQLAELLHPQANASGERP